MKLNVLKKLTILEEEVDLIREAVKISDILNKFHVGAHAIVDLDSDDDTRIKVAGRLHTVEEVKAMIARIKSGRI